MQPGNTRWERQKRESQALRGEMARPSPQDSGRIAGVFPEIEPPIADFELLNRVFPEIEGEQEFQGKFYEKSFETMTEIYHCFL